MNRHQMRRASLAAALSMAMCAAVSGNAFAQSEWGEYEIVNDGYGYLTANFPAYFTNDFILYENETGNAQLVEALMYTLSSEEKASLLNATDGYWAGLSRVGIPEVSESEQTAAPGAMGAAASFDSKTAADYGTVLANQVKSENANMLYLGDEAFGEESLLADTQAQSVRDALMAGGVIADLDTIGREGGIDGLSESEIDDAVIEKLTAIGKGGYLGLVQKSRDGLAAVDSDAPDKIELDLTAEDTTALSQQVIQKSAVLLKNEEALPLSEVPDLSAINGVSGAAVDAGEALIIYADDVVEQEAFIVEQIAAAKENGQKAVLLLACDSMQDLGSAAVDCDAILVVWGAAEDEASAIAPLLSGEVNPSGKLPGTWPGENAEADWVVGFGLSYTSYSFDILSAEPAAEGDDDYGYDVTVQVSNTGDAAGEAVAAIYLDDQTLAAYGRTQMLDAGASEELVLHISQKSLSVEDENGDSQVAEGERTIYCGNGAADQSEEMTIEVTAAKAGATVSAQAPESVSVGESFDVTVSTPTDVISLTLKDADGNVYQPLDVLKQNLGESITFVYTLQIDDTVEAQIDVYTTTTQGPSEEAAAQVIVNVQ